MEIPYVVQAHPETGVNNGKLGIWLFIASEVMLFGALFAAYLMIRIGMGEEAWLAMTTDHGKPILSVPLAFVNTLVLITSSVTMVMAWASLVKKSMSGFRLYMGLTLLCGLGFMVIKTIEYSSKFAHDPPLVPASNNFMAIYFTLTGLHALHVVGGMLVLAYFMFPGASLWKKDPEHFTNRVEHAGLFWHLVDLVWIFLFPVLYLL